MMVIAFDFVVLWYYFFSGTTALRPMAGTVWICIALVGMLLFHIRAIPLTPYMILGIMGVIGICLSIPTSVDASTSAKYALSIVLYYLVAYQITRLPDNRTIVLVLMLVFSLLMVGVTYIQAYAPDIYNAVILPLLPLRFHERILMFMKNEAYAGFYNQTSGNAITMSLGCCVSMYWLSRSCNKGCKFLSTVAIFLFLYGVILTNKRGSILVIAILIACYMWKQINNSYLKVLLLVAVGFVMFSGMWKDIPIIENFLHKNELYAAEGDVTNGRLAIWGESLLLFWNKPILGYGADMYGYVGTAGYAHNSYLQSLAELGLVGTILFYTPFVYGLSRSIRVYRRKFSYSQSEQSIIEFCLYWQLYCFLNAMLESFFATEVSVFMIFVVQMMCIGVEENHYRR